MHSASCSITDSNNEDYPGYNSDVSDSNNSSSSNTVSTLEARSCRVYKFGVFEDNHGWIQCRSKSYPDHVYYHNTRSGCNTWCRPVSRHVDIPFVSVGRANCTDDMESANDLELMSVSDNEKDSNVSGRISAREFRKRSSIDSSDIIARYYYTPWMGLSPSTDDSHSSSDEYAASERYEMKKRVDVKDDEEDNDVSDWTIRSSLCAANFLETKLFVGNDVVDTTKGTSPTFNSPLRENASPFLRERRIVYGVPRMKRISLKSQLIKPKKTCAPRSRLDPAEPRRIISDMYGMRTISYDLPGPDQACAAVGVKMTTLSDSDSDASVPPSKTTQVSKSEFYDVARNLRQPLLSDSSSSTSSWSDTTSSSSTGSSSSSCSCSCSTCSRKA